MMLFAKFLFPFVRFSWSLSLIEFYPCLILFNQYQARYSVNNGVECERIDTWLAGTKCTRDFPT